MDCTWRCNALSHRRFCRCTGPVGPPWFPVLSESKAPACESSQKRSQLAPKSAFGLADVRRAGTTADSEERLCVLSSCSRPLPADTKHTELTAVRERRKLSLELSLDFFSVQAQPLLCGW